MKVTSCRVARRTSRPRSLSPRPMWRMTPPGATQREATARVAPWPTASITSSAALSPGSSLCGSNTAKPSAATVSRRRGLVSATCTAAPPKARSVRAHRRPLAPPPPHSEAALAVAEADVEDDSAGGHPARGDRPRRPMADGVHHQFGRAFAGILAVRVEHGEALGGDGIAPQGVGLGHLHGGASESAQRQGAQQADGAAADDQRAAVGERAEERARSDEHTSELQSLMRISYAGFCLKTKQTTTNR